MKIEQFIASYVHLDIQKTSFVLLPWLYRLFYLKNKGYFHSKRAVFIDL